MNVDHVRLFRDIARGRSVTRGAERNGISQSAASQHIQEIERTLGVALLDRSTRPLQLTEAGRLYQDYCKDVLRRREEFEAALNRLKNRVEGAVRVASIYSVGLSEMARVEEEFRRQYPEAELLVQYLRPERIYEEILADRADLGLISYPEASREIAAIPWREELMVVAAPPGHPLSLRAVIAFADLDGVDFIGFDDDLPISRDLRRRFRERSVEVNLALHFDNILAIKEAVSLGQGISIVPERLLRDDVAQGRLAAIPLEEPVYRPVGIIHLRRKQFNRAIEAFLNLLQQREPAEPELVGAR
ncbi:MAG: LysR family transcriptional regulator [Bryobacteraceae bacterium]|nr:LysR family transcriptional regulator [Bryobacteraceae bacterium]